MTTATKGGYYLLLGTILLLSYAAYLTSAFSVRICKVSLSTTAHHSHLRRPSLFASASNDEETQSETAEDTFCVSFDGVLAKSVDWRIQQSLSMAMRTWPDELQCFSSDLDGDMSWLKNKMKALSYCLGAASISSSRYNPSCEYALLARCLLEEQRLDRGRSVGKSGKYASKFHPTSQPSFDDDVESQPSPQSRQRPLTVGEIGVNWSDGACLMETLLAKYSVKGKNPLGLLQDCYDDSYVPPHSVSINNRICNALLKSRATVVVMVQHESDLTIVQETLPTELLQKASIIAGSELQILQHLLTLHSPTTRARIHCVSSHYKALQHCQQVLGADGHVPRLLPGRPLPTSGVLLGLASWAENTHVSQHNDAEMNPWTSLVDEANFAELVSVRLFRS